MAENKGKEKKVSRHFTVIAVICALVLIGVFIYSVVKSNTVYRSYEEIMTLERGDNASVYYDTFLDGIVRYSKDGVAMQGKDEKIIWNQTYDMATPSMSLSANYVAVADLGGNEVYIFDAEGSTGHLTTNIPIQQIAVSDQGVVATILTDKSETYINMYDKAGKKLTSIKATFGNTGYPISMAISDNAQKMIVNYLSLNEAKVQTKAIFYDFSASGNENIIGEILLDGLYPKASFFGDSRAMLVGEYGFNIYSMDQDVQDVESVAFEDEIQSIVQIDQKNGFVFRNKDENGKYRMDIYDILGKLVKTVYFDMDYNSISTDGSEIILYNNNEINIYQSDGKLKFETSVNEDVEYVLSAGVKNYYWIVTSSNIKEIHIK